MKLRWQLVPALTVLTACSTSEDRLSDRARAMLQDSLYVWRTIETPSARVHYAAGSFAEHERDALADRVESARQAILEALGIADYPMTVDVFYVGSRQDMQRLTGAPVTGWAFIEDQTIVVVYNADWRAFERHELTHVITRNAWGEPGEPSAPTLEGFATFVDGECGGYEVGEIARTLLDERLLLGLEPLLEDFRAQNDLIAYVQAASLVEFVDKHEANNGLRALWSNGLAAAPQLLGISRGQLEREWLDWLEASHTPIPDEAWQRIRSDGCGIEARPAADSS